MEEQTLPDSSLVKDQRFDVSGTAARSTLSSDFHRVWLGNDPIPAIYEQYWKAWQRQLPDATFRTWRDQDVENLPLAGPLLPKVASAVQASDIARYDIILQNGGTYLDCDILPLVYPDVLGGDELVTCNENSGDDIRSIGFFAAPPGNPTLHRALEIIGSMELGVSTPNIETGPALFRKAIAAERRLPSSAFYPYHHTEPFSRVFDRDLSRTYGIHVWGRSWLSEEALTTAAAHCFHAGDVGEAEALLVRRANPILTERAQRMLELCRQIRNMRLTLVHGLRNPTFRMALRKGWAGGIKFEAGPRPKVIQQADGVSSLFEAGWCLLSHYPDSVVWQIGACDGILVDPIRSLLVNFDPVCLLVEPHPELYTRLVRNYRRNERMVTINAAMGRSGGKADLIAIDPYIAGRDNLPDWSLGISSLYRDRNALGGKRVTDALQKRLLAATRAVPVVVHSPADVRRQTGLPWPDMLVVDTEGADAEIVAAFLDEGVAPKILYFETVCVPESEVAQIKQRLLLTYFAIEATDSVLFIRHDFLDEILELAWVEQGRISLPSYLGLSIVLPGVNAD